MNGAEALLRTLVDAGVDICLPTRTSEMHFVAAPTAFWRCAASWASSRARSLVPPTDARMAAPGRNVAAPRTGLRQRSSQPPQRPQRRTPMVNIVGDHARAQGARCPLESDIEAVAGTVSGWAVAATALHHLHRRCGGGCRSSRGAWGRHADPAGRCGVVRRCPARSTGGSDTCHGGRRLGDRTTAGFDQPGSTTASAGSSPLNLEVPIFRCAAPGHRRVFHETFPTRMTRRRPVRTRPVCTADGHGSAGRRRGPGAGRCCRTGCLLRLSRQTRSTRTRGPQRPRAGPAPTASAPSRSSRPWSTGSRR